VAVKLGATTTGTQRGGTRGGFGCGGERGCSRCILKGQNGELRGRGGVKWWPSNGFNGRHLTHGTH
jgi:hypothetical protein